jgi:hypothetical protein
MKIKLTTNRFCFEVKSSTGLINYQVDIKANEGAGKCQCQDFNRRKLAAVNRKEPKGTTATACKHILAARQFYLNQQLS